MEEIKKLKIPVFIPSGYPPSTPLQIADLAEVFPEVSIIMGHSGFTTFWLELLPSMKRCENLFGELSCQTNIRALKEAIEKIGIERFLYGSSLPFSHPIIEIEKIKLLKLSKEEKFNDVYLHLFTDGIDSPPKSALSLIEKLIRLIKNENLPGKIATLCGRFYALDKSNEYFLRTQRAFLLLVEGKGNIAKDPIDFLKEKYKDPDFNDSILEPTIFESDGFIKDNDAVLFFNHETKNIFQLANSFLNPDFKEFKRPERKNLYIISLTKYLENIDHPFIYEEQKIKTNLSRIIAENKLKQIKIIDAPRKELLTFYFNGFFEEEHPDEVFKFLPSFDSDWKSIEEATYQLFDYLKIIVKEGIIDFVVANLPVFEIIGNHGDFRLAINAIEKIDVILGEFANLCLKSNYSLILTSDHGNIEKMIDLKLGKKDTLHNSNPVPFHLIDKDYYKEKTSTELIFFEKKILGSLVDIAPTILDLMKLKIPPEFIGKSLLRYF